MSMTMKPEALATKAGRRSFARSCDALRSSLLGVPQRPRRVTAKYSAKQLVSTFGPRSEQTLLLWYSLGIGRALCEGCT